MGSRIRCRLWQTGWDLGIFFGVQIPLLGWILLLGIYCMWIAWVHRIMRLHLDCFTLAGGTMPWFWDEMWTWKHPKSIHLLWCLYLPNTNTSDSSFIEDITGETSSYVHWRTQIPTVHLNHIMKIWCKQPTLVSERKRVQESPLRFRNGFGPTLALCPWLVIGES